MKKLFLIAGVLSGSLMPAARLARRLGGARVMAMAVAVAATPVPYVFHPKNPADAEFQRLIEVASHESTFKDTLLSLINAWFDDHTEKSAGALVDFLEGLKKEKKLSDADKGAVCRMILDGRLYAAKKRADEESHRDLTIYDRIFEVRRTFLALLYDEGFWKLSRKEQYEKITKLFDEADITAHQICPEAVARRPYQALS